MRVIMLLLTTGLAVYGMARADDDGQTNVPGERLNVVFILADDLGYTDLGCYGSKFYETPNIDRLAAEGVRLTDGYTCGPNCQPTRAALMTGLYGPRTGVYTVGSIDRFNWRSRPLRPVDNVQELPLDLKTIGDRFQAANYRTALFGKWHLGQDGPYHPAERGFDEAIVSMRAHFNFKTTPPVKYPPGTYLADFLTDRAVDFLHRHRDQPFFLYVPHFLVHTPIEAKPELRDRFVDKPPVGGHDNPEYAGMIASLDESVGRILDTLAALQLDQRTLVVFSSDNGGVGGYVREGLKKNRGFTDNAPLRGGKGMLYEGGIRIPFIFRLPGRLEAGRVCETPINSVDILPTLLEACDLPLPTSGETDGTSVWPVLEGRAEGTGRPNLYWHFPGYLGAGKDGWRTTPVSVVRSGDWKLMEFLEDNHLELYNLKDDLSETRNLAVDKPELAARLRADLHAWRDRVGAKLPTPRNPE